MNSYEIIKQQINELNIFYNTIDYDKINNIGNIISNIPFDSTMIIYGIGKSENIAIHMASVFNSINIKCIAGKAQNCLHGDIGFIRNSDYVVLISNSGNTKELIDIIPYIKIKTNNIIGFFSNSNAKLIKFCSHYIILPKVEELIHNIPTTSVITYITLINILLTYVSKKNNININIFNQNHPNGNIGNLINIKIKNIMLLPSKISIIQSNITIKDCLFDMCKYHLRCAILLEYNKIKGFITDGNIRRYLLHNESSLNDNIINCINKNPTTINENDTIEKIVNIIKEDNRLISGIPVINNNNEFVGLVSQNQIIEYL